VGSELLERATDTGSLFITEQLDTAGIDVVSNRGRRRPRCLTTCCGQRCGIDPVAGGSVRPMTT
jgi:hypothetical protein